MKSRFRNLFHIQKLPEVLNRTGLRNEWIENSDSLWPILGAAELCELNSLRHCRRHWRRIPRERMEWKGRREWIGGGLCIKYAVCESFACGLGDETEKGEGRGRKGKVGRKKIFLIWKVHQRGISVNVLLSDDYHLFTHATRKHVSYCSGLKWHNFFFF